MARTLGQSGTPSVVIDTATRPQEALRVLAGLMAGPYLALPRADARRLSQALESALGP
jgi:magnesium chelatase subunit D